MSFRFSLSQLMYRKLKLNKPAIIALKYLKCFIERHIEVYSHKQYNLELFRAY